MMTGTVNADLEALLRLVVRDGLDQPHVVEAVLDTGFNGFLTLPPPLIARFGLAWLCRQQGELADGSIQVFDVYVAAVDYDGQRRSVEVDATDGQSLIGMALMNGSELRIEIRPGGVVTLRALP
jgi:clan AA aspartic protease